MEPVDYLTMRFTGRAAATSMSGAWLTDNRRSLGCYDSTLVRRAGLDASSSLCWSRPGRWLESAPGLAAGLGSPRDRWSPAALTCTPPPSGRARSARARRT